MRGHEDTCKATNMRALNIPRLHMFAYALLRNLYFMSEGQNKAKGRIKDNI
jgi:hypothetical protein